MKIYENLKSHRLRVFGNKVRRRILRPKMVKVKGGCRKLHDEELHNLCSSAIVTRMIRSRRMKWMEHVVCIGRWEM
jgi:hypothetical protein